MKGAREVHEKGYSANGAKDTQTARALRSQRKFRKEIQKEIQTPKLLLTLRSRFAKITGVT